MTPLLKFLIPLLPDLIMKTISFLWRRKSSNAYQKRAKIIERSEEFDPAVGEPPDNLEIVQCRDLPRHKTRVWERRKLMDVIQIVIHHTATDCHRAGWTDISRYVTTPSSSNHLSKGGAPYVPYHFGIGTNGVFQFNDLDQVVWGALGFNLVSIHVAILGDFSTEGTHKGKNQVQPIHTKQLQLLLHYLRDKFPRAKITTHKHLGKWACPGDELVQFVEHYKEQLG